MKHIRLVVLAPALVPLAFTLPGCGKEEHKKAATQVVAKVNGDEISVHQINFVLSRAQGINAENAEQAKQDILNKLIDQQLAVQQAEATKLDRDPGVMQTIEATRRDVLARAYLEKIAAAQPKPTEDEARKYYAEHPELFAQRRIYNLQEILVPAANVGEVQQLVAQNRSMQDIAATLKARDVKFAANAGVRSAEQLPLNVIARLHTVKDGQTVIIEAPQGAMVVRVVASQSQPVPEGEALPRIQQFFANQRNVEAVTNELKALRTRAKIEQTGEIAIAPVAAAPAAAAPKAAAPAPAAAPAAINESSVAKGVAGLK
jgi:EpsD family peptidyl-prolyl cis-trans isomerase